MERFDVLIVGAGPAGSTTAYRLADAGARVLLIDRARFPRDKPCGGAISARALRELPLDPHPVIEHVADKMELSYRGRHPHIRGGTHPLAYLTQRSRLDHFLLEQALSAGAELRDGARVTEISEHGARVDGKQIACQLLIGADGANGPTARSLALTGKRIYGVAFEGNLAHEHLDPERWRSRVVIELGTIPGGYCWIFPKGAHVNIGVGGWESVGPTLRRHPASRPPVLLAAGVRVSQLVCRLHRYHCMIFRCRHGVAVARCGPTVPSTLVSLRCPAASTNCEWLGCAGMLFVVMRSMGVWLVGRIWRGSSRGVICWSVTA